MKRISKGRPPASLKKWFDGQNGINCSFTEMPSAVKNEVKERLLLDQGYLCCYTGKRVETHTSHIEHLKPQSLSRSDGDNDDVNYGNMLAAYPKDDRPPCPYGAKVRGDWYDAAFIHPLCPDCEQRFVFNFKGEIAPRDPKDSDAGETIKRLGLNHPYLTADRKAAIDELLDDISEAQAKELQAGMMQRDSKGKFRVFCFVLAQACEEFLRRREQRRAKRLAIERQQK